MCIRKGLILLLGIILLSSLVIAQDYKIAVSTLKSTYESGEDITLKVSLFDVQNNPINDEVFLIIEDSEKRIKQEETILSNEFIDISLPEGASYGKATITAKYKDSETIGSFIIEIRELAKFDLDGETLVVTNIGNTEYTKTIQITIGETTGIKQPKLGVGESVKYKLIAPEGLYDIRVSDGNSETSFTKSGVKLTGTGNVVGAISDEPSKRTSITGGISPDENSDEALLSYIKKNKFVYVFVFVIFGAMILLAVERRFKKKAS